MTEEPDFRDDELINVRLPRSDLEVIRKVIEREKAYSWLTTTLKTNWIWVVAGGAISCLVLYDKISALIQGVK